MAAITPEQLDELLPQTQCGLCGHGGCMPYAEAMVFEHAPINLCPPGGVETLRALGDILHQDPRPYEAEMAQKAKPNMRAIVRENECIGCTKCLPVCPVDAILGSAKQMHTVIAAECTGCELCIPACPVDCIQMVASDTNLQANSHHYRKRYQTKQKREQTAKLAKETKGLNQSQTARKNYVEEAIARAKAKKS